MFITCGLLFFVSLLFLIVYIDINNPQGLLLLLSYLSNVIEKEKGWR